MVKNVAVIGAGISGLIAIKYCLEEGLEPTCFERSDDIGGVWRFTDEVEVGRGSIYKSLVANASKELMALSDFPMPEDFPNFLPNEKFLEYCRLYSEHFKLGKYIKFKTKVCSVKKNTDFPLTGQWVVVTETIGEKETAIFDAVMVCGGQYNEPSIDLDTFPGIEKFKGQVMHCREYKRAVGFDGKQVLIIGMGNSGVDVSTELCTKASKVYISTTSGVWVIRRLGEGGYPWDLKFVTRFKNFILSSVPPSWARWIIKNYMNQYFNHHFYGIQPKGIVWKEPLVNEEFPSRILSGSVVVKPGIKRFTENSAHFEDGTKIDNLDVVILATGYKYSFPFLDESVVKVDDSKGFLYKKIIPLDLEKPTLAIIGIIQHVGPAMVSAELQSWWATRLFKGLIKLPSAAEMKEELSRDEKLRLRWFATAKNNCRRTEYIQYLDEIAAQIGIKPNLFKLFITDPVLAMKVLFGPCNAYQYRLTGPGKFPGAREAIMTQWKRIEKPLKTRVVEDQTSFNFSTIFLWFICLVILFVAMLVIH
ncbi:hypothetical protein GDO86_007668 [Hymenochirus boettgeri]|uniref:Flavin-containing monooxygenase n=1 Tax=Hymenochirus boettgeri TaxID=247094 RepID=A0A8T2IYS2_9PIPI|nr:hypothetical protein GDO86_007668 [Hymenochirus boettgeri]